MDFGGDIMLIDRDDKGALVPSVGVALTGGESMWRERGSGDELPPMAATCAVEADVTT